MAGSEADRLRAERGFDALGLVVAGVVDALALLDAGLVLAPGTAAATADLDARMEWVAGNSVRWQIGWTFWFVVTTTFAWSYYALARNLRGPRQWRDLAVGVALLAAAVDMVGLIVNIVVLPPVAVSRGSFSGEVAAQGAQIYAVMESLASVLTSVASFGLYTVAGLLLIPALFATAAYPRWLAWMGAAEWGVSAVATVLLAAGVAAAAAPLLFAWVFYIPWIWGSAWWLVRTPVGTVERAGDRGSVEVVR